MSAPQRVLFIFGTRPEAIKLAPVIQKIKKDVDFNSFICITAQHRQMLDQVLEFFEISADFDLNVMTQNQALTELSAKILMGLTEVFKKVKPDLVMVQGDTTSAFLGGLAAFYNQTPVAHLEAGLRTNQLYSPFPEEANRRLLSVLSHFHFCPTQTTLENLRREIKSDKIFHVGNTVIDALLQSIEKLEANVEFQVEFEKQFKSIDFKQKIILMTVHRRESFGEPIRNIFKAVKKFAVENVNYQIVFPVHPNPNVKFVAQEFFGELKNVSLVDPFSYPQLIWIMKKCHFIITDSGGIQEEAPSLKKPVLILRDVTERMEGVLAGCNKLVGTSTESIYMSMTQLVQDPSYYESFSKAENPFGDGQATERVLAHLKRHLG